MDYVSPLIGNLAPSLNYIPATWDACSPGLALPGDRVAIQRTPPKAGHDSARSAGQASGDRPEPPVPCEKTHADHLVQPAALGLRKAGHHHGEPPGAYEGFASGT